jgi:hypothetical protein
MSLACSSYFSPECSKLCRFGADRISPLHHTDEGEMLLLRGMNEAQLASFVTLNAMRRFLA